MYVINVIYVLIVCLFGIVLSSPHWADPLLNDFGNEDLSTNKKKRLHSTKAKRYALDISSFGNTCVAKYSDICGHSNYEIRVNNGISGYTIKAMLIQKETSDIVSVHHAVSSFSTDGSALLKFDDIPSLHYNIILEVTDLIYNKDYTIGNKCLCNVCNDTKIEINLSNLENNIIYATRGHKQIKLPFPQSSFVNGKLLFSNFSLYHSQINLKSIENYEEIYKNQYELVRPCSGIIMVHSEKYKIHYDIKSVHCYHVYIIDKIMKKITSNDQRSINFKNNMFLMFDENKTNEDDMISVVKNYSIQLPLKYDNGFYYPQSTVNGLLVTINVNVLLNNIKNIYINNIDKKMEYIQIFRIIIRLMHQYNEITYDNLLQYTTNLTLEKSKSPSSLINTNIYNVYAEELTVLLNSLSLEFNPDIIGLDKNVVLMEEKEFISQNGIDTNARIYKNQLILKESSDVCLVLLQDIAREISSYVNNKLDHKYTGVCKNLRKKNSYANMSVMHYTYEIDCNISIFYKEYNTNEGLMITNVISNKSLFEDVYIQLHYYDIYEYGILFHIQVDQNLVRYMKSLAKNYINNDSVIVMNIIGRKTDKLPEDIDQTLKIITFPIDCTTNCSNAESIIIHDNYDYISIENICIKNTNGSEICFPKYNYSYIFDTRLLLVHMININPYPEITLHAIIHQRIVEGNYCILSRHPLLISHEYTPRIYKDNVCKEYINRCELLSTNVVVKSINIPSSILQLKNKFKLSFTTDFDEKHEEMFQVNYLADNDIVNISQKKHLLTHYNNSFYINQHDNLINESKRQKEDFNPIVSIDESSHNYIKGNGELYNEENAYKNIDNIQEMKYDINIFNMERMYTHEQTSKNNDSSLYPFGGLSINYSHVKKNIYMKFLNDYIYFYESDSQKSDYNTVSALSEDKFSHFTNVSVYNYECLGAYAYLMNKFNILVNDSLNCEAIHMIIEVLLKGKLGKYFIYNKNKIFLNFIKKEQYSDDIYDVFDLIDVEIYEQDNLHTPKSKHRLNVSIDENNLNLLYSHKNVLYRNKYFSNIYILMFKIAYLSNEYDFYTFFYDLTGIRLIDETVLINMDKLSMEDQTYIQYILLHLENNYNIKIEEHTNKFEELINEISLLAAYIVELTSSYKIDLNTTSVESENELKSFANIKYFVYINEFKYHGKNVSINQLVHTMSQFDTLIIKKKVLCCSNFVDEVEASLKYYLMYKYVHTGTDLVNENDDIMPPTAYNIIQTLLERPIPKSDIYDKMTKSNIDNIATHIMKESGYIHKNNITTEYKDLECIHLDSINHYDNIITHFETKYDNHGSLVSMTILKGLLKDKSIDIQEDMDYSVYFSFRNLSVPFIGKTHREETLDFKRILLLKAFPKAINESVVFYTYIDQLDGNSLFMLEKIIFVSKGNKLVKEINVEYQTFFVHPHNMILTNNMDSNTHINTYSTYFNELTRCYHYNNGIQACNYPEYGYNGFTPYYVFYTENNQRKEILFKDNEEIANLINNKPLTLTKRYNIELGGEKMDVEIYNSVEVIINEIAFSIGLKNFNEKNCSKLTLNNGLMHIPNDPNSLISSIYYETLYCLDKSAIYKKILTICNFDKEELIKLFSASDSNILPYNLEDTFAKSLTHNEIINLITYFISAPYQINMMIRRTDDTDNKDVNNDIKPLILNIMEFNSTENSESKIVFIENEDIIKINKQFLQKEVDNSSLLEFNKSLYFELLKYMPDSFINEHKILIDMKDINNYLKSYINKENICNNDSYFKNNGIMLVPGETSTYNQPSFTYINNDNIYIKKKPEDSYIFNNIFLFEGKNNLDKKFLNAIVVLSPIHITEVHDISYVELIANAFDNKHQFSMKCYPHKKYDNSYFEKEFNLAPNSIYFVCMNVYTMYLKSGLYEFNKYLIKFNTTNSNTYHVYQNMPVRPVYTVKNNNIIVPDMNKIDLKLHRIKDDDMNSVLIKYLIYVDGSITLHTNPYVVVNPIFTEDSYYYNTNIRQTDDYVSFMYSRKLKLFEFLELPTTQMLFKENTMTITTEQFVHYQEETHNIYLLTLVKTLNLTKVIIRDIYNNEFEITIDLVTDEKPVAPTNVHTETPLPTPPISTTTDIIEEKEEEKVEEKEEEKEEEKVEEKEEEKEEEKVEEKEEEKVEEKEEEKIEEKVEEKEEEKVEEKEEEKSNVACKCCLIKITNNTGSNGNCISVTQYLFLVQSLTSISEGKISLHVSENGYELIGNDDNLPINRTLNLLCTKLNGEVKLTNGDYNIQISNYRYTMPKSTIKISNGYFNILRINEDGTRYIAPPNVFINGEKPFTVDLNIPKITSIENTEKVSESLVPEEKNKSQVIDVIPIPSVEEKKQSKPSFSNYGWLTNQRTISLNNAHYYRRNVTCSIYIKSIELYDDKDKMGVYENKYDINTNSLHYGVYEIHVNNGKSYGSCKNGHCLLDYWFLNYIIHSNQLKNGVYMLHIKNYINIHRIDQHESNPNHVTEPSKATVTESLPVASKSVFCASENLNTLESFDANKKIKIIREVETNSNMNAGIYIVHINYNNYEVYAEKENHKILDTGIFESCIKHDFDIKDDMQYIYKVQILNGETKDIRHKENERIFIDKNNNKFKEYYAFISSIENNDNRSAYGYNNITRFYGPQHIVKSKYIINGQNLHNIKRINQNGYYENIDEKDEEIIMELFNSLFESIPHDKLYFIEIFDEDFDYSLITDFESKIGLEMDSNNSGSENASRTNEILSDTQNNIFMVQIAEYRGMDHQNRKWGYNDYDEFMLQGDFIKPGHYDIVFSNGKYTINYYSSDEKKIKASDIENIIMSSGKILKNSYYKIHIVKWENSEESMLINDLFHTKVDAAKSKDNKYAATEVKDSDNTASSSVVPSKKEGGGFYRSYISLKLKYDESDKYGIKKVVDGIFDSKIVDSKYSVRMLNNNSYRINILNNSNVHSKSIIDLIKSVWNCNMNGNNCIYDIEIYAYNTVERGNNGMDSNNDDYYYIIIEPIKNEEEEVGNSDKVASKKDTEYIKIIGKNLPIGHFNVVVENDTFNGTDANKMKVDTNLIKTIMFLSFEKPLDGKYNVTIVKNNDSILTNCSEYNTEMKEKISPTHKGTHQHITIRGFNEENHLATIFQKDIHFQKGNGIKDGQYSMQPHLNGTYSIRSRNYKLSTNENTILQDILLGTSVKGYSILNITTIDDGPSELLQYDLFSSKNCISLQNDNTNSIGIRSNILPSIENSESSTIKYKYVKSKITNAITHCSSSNEMNCLNVLRRA
ncbi:oocyst capsule protein [Plasmodium chabaudi chabaudi]|uniref:Oocyst capsule protein n=1 Tax=Plasmodium chabaudi chabaudi TaxID=31271 RepID=A0A1D3S0J7_PLACU|nr:oocyst capsule protein [Plasmodium chabaudi chabaudi]